MEYSKKHKIIDKHVTDSTFSAKILVEDNIYVTTQLGFKKFNKKEKSIINTLKYQTKYVELIEKNVFPEELYEELYKLNIQLFPSSIINIDLRCNCSYQNIICKHIVALLYDFTFELEDNPFLLFELKGSKIKSLPYKSEKEKNIENKNHEEKVQNISQVMNDGEIIHEISDNQEINYEIIPDLYSNLLLLEDKPSFFEKNFKKILEEGYTHFSTYAKEIEEYKLFEKGKYNDFIKLELPPKKTFNDKNKVKNIFIQKWGAYDFWKYLHINLNSNYSITRVDTGTKDNFSRYKSEKVLFGFLTELSHLNLEIHNNELNFLLSVYKFTIELIKKNAIVPEFVTCNDKYLIRWIPPYNNSSISELIIRLAYKCPESIITFNKKKISKKNQVITCVSLLIKGFIDNLLENSNNSLNEYSDNNIISIFMGNAERFDENNKEKIEKSIQQWLKPLSKNKTNYTVYMNIIENDKFFKIDVNVDVNDNIQPIIEVINKTEDNKLKNDLLEDAKTIYNVFPNINNLIENNEDILLTANEFAKFFNNVLPILETMGIKIIIPKSLDKKLHPKLLLKIKQENHNQQYLSYENLLKFDWKIAIGDKDLSIEEFEKLTRNNKNLIKLADNFVILDQHDVKQLIKKINLLPDKLSNYELIKSVATGEFMDIEVDIDENIKNHIINKSDSTLPLPKTINANLREYQNIGYRWLAQNIQCGFGSILADDMGLGKTLQVLTLILKLKEEGLLNEEKVLVIAPTSLLLNWQREINKFTPKMLSHIYHGPDRTLKDSDYDILITSYAIIRQDKKEINKLKWLLIVVDEAQNIKNHNTQQTKAIKSINAKYHIALSGTPIENRLSEYWSIFDFVNNGYLGSLTSFRKEYINPIENEKNFRVLNNFKIITQPFILRRLKTDKKIMKELPEKVSYDIYCNLTVPQAALYQETVNVHMKEIENEKGISRKGRVLELINALKQICNHPAQYITSNKAEIEDSGKMLLLMDYLETILDNDEKVLIFTQYVKTGHIMKKLIEEHLKEHVLFLHGSLSRKERDEAVYKFQEDSNYRIFVLSLKAGGTGLNLTAATNVIHYDLWWNPAVENQATDRAYRIGQKSNVMVYRFITSGTFEERINEMIEDKKELAEIAIGNGGQFITEMSDEKLREMLKLRK